MIIPWMLNRNGQSISLKSAFKGKVGADPKALKSLAMDAKAKGSPMTFAMTFPPGTHAMWIRYWLAAGGINAALGNMTEVGLFWGSAPDMAVPDLEICLVHRAPFGDQFFASVIKRVETGEPLADGVFSRGLGHIQVAVFFGEAFDFRCGVFFYQAEAAAVFRVVRI